MEQALAFLFLVCLLALCFSVVGGIIVGTLTFLEFITEKKAVFIRQISEGKNVYSVYRYGNIFSKKVLYLAEQGIHVYGNCVYNADGSMANNEESEAVKRHKKAPPLVVLSILKAEEEYHGE